MSLTAKETGLDVLDWYLVDGKSTALTLWLPALNAILKVAVP
jgi:hypothetical protein